MPPLITYTFKLKYSNYDTITIQIYGDREEATKRLSNLVINTNDWYL